MVIATGIIGVDTLWGGDVNDFSGTRRLIADSYFSDYELPPCFFDLVADQLRESEGVLGTVVSNDDVAAFVAKFEIRKAVEFLASGASALTAAQRKYQTRMGEALLAMLDLALSLRGLTAPVPYERLVKAGTGFAPQLFDVSAERAEVTKLLAEIGDNPDQYNGDVMAAVDAYRQKRALQKRDIVELNKVFIPELDAGAVKNILPYLPTDWAEVSRTNVVFKFIEGAHFSGSLNYLGLEREDDGRPKYEAVYEINADIEITRAGFEFLVAHEVVPGHVMTTALIHYAWYSSAPGFGIESTIFPMCSPASTLSEGIGNCGLLLAHGWKSAAEIPDPEMRLNFILDVLQDYAKANISYRLYAAKMAPEEVSRVTRAECFLSAERAEKLTFAWGGHPLLGQMYLPAYAVGTNIVGALLEKHGAAKLIPALYGARGPVDILSLEELIA